MSSSKKVSHTYWLEHIKQWQASGLTQADYCKQNKLLPHRLGYWKRKLLNTNNAQGSPSGFTRVKINQPLVTSTGLSLALPNGYRLDGINLDNLTTVQALVGCLK